MKYFAITLVVLLVFCVSLTLLTGQETPNPLPCETNPERMACIPGGAFIRGSNDGPPHARPESTVWVQTFYMDIYEVTYEEYQRCMAEGKCDKARPYGMRSWNAVLSGCDPFY